MAKISPLVLLPPLMFVALAATFYLGMQREDPDAIPSTREGLAAPEAVPAAVGALPTFASDVITAEGIKVVNFWASWCGPCRAEHPSLKLLAENYPVYGINRDVDPVKALDFLDELGNPFTAVNLDERNRQSIEWGVYALPETFFIDGDGKVFLHFRGPITERSMESTVLPALEKARLEEGLDG
jgi:cytochrome c biogenesis protein CcmG/thiol:disulfide interchange protein DsbE